MPTMKPEYREGLEATEMIYFRLKVAPWKLQNISKARKRERTLNAA
jgi:hypothetical protein